MTGLSDARQTGGDGGDRDITVLARRQIERPLAQPVEGLAGFGVLRGADQQGLGGQNQSAAQPRPGRVW